MEESSASDRKLQLIAGWQVLGDVVLDAYHILDLVGELSYGLSALLLCASSARQRLRDGPTANKPVLPGLVGAHVRHEVGHNVGHDFVWNVHDGR